MPVVHLDLYQGRDCVPSVSITVGQPARRGRHRPNEAGPLMLMMLGTAVAFGLLLASRDLGVIQGPRAELPARFEGSLLLEARPEVAAASEPQNWTHRVRIGGYGAPEKRASAIVREATDSHVFGIEVDNDITGRYESFLDPEEKLAASARSPKRAHAAGNRAFVYIAGTECITKDGDKQPAHARQGPSGLASAQALVANPPSFTGGAAFWIRKGDEDVWISPVRHSPGASSTWTRVRQIAATGIDGIYVDIPVLDDPLRRLGGLLGELRRLHRRGLPPEDRPRCPPGPEARQLRGPAFPPMDRLPHRNHHRVHGEIDRNAKAVNPGIMTIPEIYPGIEREAVVVGADVYQLYRRHRCHRPRVRSSAAGNHMATSRTPLDWFRYQVGMRSFRAFAQGKATWILNYSWDGDKNIAPPEPMMNLAMSVVMAGANFWDAATHVMSGSNDLPTRKRIFEWIEKHEKTLYEPRVPIHPIGVYFSPATRNYFPGRVHTLLSGHGHPAAAGAPRVPDRDAAHARGVSRLDADPA